ncbi:MAG: type II toxin-antitoxin system RelE/ParE family toxin [Terricaulis sp.]
MRFEFARGRRVGRDLERIYDFLFVSYMEFGESADEADERAAKRVEGIEAAMERLAAHPHQGTLHPELMPGLRSVTKDRAVFYFIVDEEARTVRVLAVFFGGREHQREMLMRLAVK